jgi:hypothetical protein
MASSPAASAAGSVGSEGADILRVPVGSRTTKQSYDYLSVHTHVTKRTVTACSDERKHGTWVVRNAALQGETSG